MEIEKLDERLCSNFLKFSAIKYEKIVKDKFLSGYVNSEFDTKHYIITIGIKELHLEFSYLRKDSYSFSKVIGSFLLYQLYDLGDTIQRKKVIKSKILFKDKTNDEINLLVILKKELLKNIL
jgi:hypothetical protein